MYFTGTQVGFRPAAMTSMDIDQYLSDINESVQIFDAAQTVDVYSYNTVNKTNAIVYDISYYNENFSNPEKAFLSSVSDSFTVNAGETIVKRFTIDASLTSVKQPDCVSAISPLPYDPSTSGNGQYVVVGRDNLPIKPEQWIAQGGSLTVAITENANEIEVTIVAPDDPFLLRNDGNGITLGPYKVGTEVSFGGYTYPALYIVGAGTFYKKTKTTFITGAGSSTTNPSAPVVDNIFITDNFTLANAGIAAAQAACSPKVSVNGASASGFTFGSTIGKSFSKNSNKFRLDTINFNQGGVDWTAKSCATFSDFHTKNTGKTFAQFDSMITASATFIDFSVIPLTAGV